MVRFVYGRCGAEYALPGHAMDQRGPRKVKSSDTEALQRAVQELGGLKGHVRKGGLGYTQ